jgi:hypothetical protein
VGLDRSASLCYLFGVMLAVGSCGLCLMYLLGEQQPGRGGMDDEFELSNGEGFEVRESLSSCARNSEGVID